MMHSESIHSRLVVGIFSFNFTFRHESPVVQGVMRQFSLIYRGVGVLLCRKDPRGNTAPSNYSEKLMQYSLRGDF